MSGSVEIYEDIEEKNPGQDYLRDLSYQFHPAGYAEMNDVVQRRFKRVGALTPLIASFRGRVGRRGGRSFL